MSGVTFSVLAERVQYYDKDGKLITESLHDYTRRTVHEEFASLDDFVKRWNRDRPQAGDRRRAAREGRAHRSARRQRQPATWTPFDLICHVAFDQPPLTRRERADNVRKRDVFTKYGDTARAVLDALLDKYADQGIDAIEDVTVLKVDPLARLGTTTELVRSFGGRTEYTEAVRELEAELYKNAN